jgi:hypothetical protein
MSENSWVTAQLAANQEGLNTVKLFKLRLRSFFWGEENSSNEICFYIFVVEVAYTFVTLRNVCDCVISQHRLLEYVLLYS